jgi:uncharacterized protein YuzE
MKIHYDPHADALSVRFSDTEIIESEEVTAGSIFDFDSKGRIVAVEILHASDRLAEGIDLEAIARQQAA